eukprot:CAMPEP_0203668276 /NCGR_PEP_ID=MMETSP0090-20130426/4948_1 /ASSEMBLY_ACC=CAM_ASM_001088 /TAXON_ID=426623 /ORGANISM="Chaetoceros affinis, Strain CCMP159" /LENGTH=134 /DNA_ID=CAMNT_0050532673 /DNA_START=1291 /DNA_END=1695 /DNA_ORIENTATION=+
MGRRNSSNNFENAKMTAAAPAAEIDSPTIGLSRLQEKSSNPGFSGTTNSPPIDVYSACEEGSGESTRDFEYCTTNNLFPIYSSALMKPDSSNQDTSSPCEERNNDDSCDELFLGVAKEEDFGGLRTNRHLDDLY